MQRYYNALESYDYETILRALQNKKFCLRRISTYKYILRDFILFLTITFSFKLNDK